MSTERARSTGRARLADRLVRLAATVVEPVARPLDRALARRTRIVDRIPAVGHRRGGKRSYAEWAWAIGLLQTLVTDLLDDVDQPRVVDVGCGSGLALIAAEPSVADGGQLIGLDVDHDAIEFCRRHYPSPPYRFATVAASHPVYAPDRTGPGTWPVETGSVDLVTALSVLTHLGPTEASATLAEAARVLRPGAAALVSAFLLDPDDPGPPPASASAPASAPSRFHRTDPTRWRFDRPLGHGWFAPSWADPPELAVGLTGAAVEQLAGSVGLTVERILPGTWRERRGLYFQDLVVLRRVERPS